MENVFLNYMRDRTGKPKKFVGTIDVPGPVITISRDYGCPAKRIARKLAETLNEKNRTQGINKEWRWLSKEIIEESARELNLTPSLTKDLTEYKNRSFFENMALFFSDEFYPGDAKIKNTIAKFIHTAATEGNVIIVGRAAEAITKNIDQAFHVKLEAPVAWRIETISEMFGMTTANAKKEVEAMDKRRKQFRNYFEKGKADIDFFNAIFNSKEMTDDEIIEILVIASETRGFV